MCHTINVAQQKCETPTCKTLFSLDKKQRSRINTIDGLEVEVDGGAAEGDDAICKKRVRMIIDE